MEGKKWVRTFSSCMETSESTTTSSSFILEFNKIRMLSSCRDTDMCQDNIVVGFLLYFRMLSKSKLFGSLNIDNIKLIWMIFVFKQFNIQISMFPAITKCIFLVPAKTGAYFMESNKQETRSRERTLFYPQPGSTCKTYPLGKLPKLQFGTLDTATARRESGRPTASSAMLQKSGPNAEKTPSLDSIHTKVMIAGTTAHQPTHRPRVQGVALYEIGLPSKVELFVAQLLFRQIPNRTLMASGGNFLISQAPQHSTVEAHPFVLERFGLCGYAVGSRSCNVVICNSIIMELSSSFTGKSKTCLGESLVSL